MVASQLLLATATAATPPLEPTGAAAESAATKHPAITPLLHAILEGNPASVKRLLDGGADVNLVRRLPAEALGRHAPALAGRESITTTPLLAAVQTGNLAVVEILLAGDADPDLAGDSGMTPLLLAVERGDKLIAERLIAAGADVNARDDTDNTPLMAAVKRSDRPLVELLLAHDVDLDVPDDRGVTPLRAAIEIPDTKLADLLASHGAALEPAGDEEDHLEAAVDIRGFDAWLEAAAPAAPLRAAALGLAIDSDAGKIYWTEYQAGRIRRANLDGSGIETLVQALGPVGIAVDAAAGRIYWTTDGPYPWSIQTAGLDGGGVRDLLSGRFLNRPTDILLQLEPRKMYWAETVAGRIRRANPDGTGIEDIVTSGLGIQVHAGSEVTTVPGIALDAVRRVLYWTELTHGLIQRVSLDGGGEKTLRDRSTDLGSPVGLAIDVSEQKLYWADQASATIQRVNLDGGNAETLVTRAQGLERPSAIAIDLRHRKLYWTDVATDTIARVGLDGSNVELIVRLHPAGDAEEVDRGRENTEICSQLPARHVNRLLAPIEVCLDTVGAVKAVKARADEAGVAAEVCARQLLRWQNRRAPETTVSAELTAQIEPQCKATLDATQQSHIVREAQRLAITDLVQRYARSREWLEEVRPFIAALPPSRLQPARIEDALAALDALDVALGELPRMPRINTSPGLPASGQVSSYRATTARGASAFEGVADDGAVRAGGELRYVDNGDGTITDRNTGLMWEKKCDCPGDLHHYHREYRWSDNEGATIWDWLDAINTEKGRGLAGYRDWRIPNIKELHSIVDYERFNPAISTAFDAAACGLGCTDASADTCSCTEANAYWTSTTFAEDMTLAFVVGFNIGLVGEITKQAGLPVRAVRGGLVAEAKDR